MIHKQNWRGADLNWVHNLWNKKFTSKSIPLVGRRNVLTVGITYFFRKRTQWRSLWTQFATRNQQYSVPGA